MPLGAFRLNTLSKAAGGASFVSATGGVVTDINVSGVNYRLHEFTTSGTFSVQTPGVVELFAVGGGGSAFYYSGPGYGGEGGGGGGVIDQTDIEVATQDYNIIIGVGGVPGRYGSSPPQISGTNTTALGFTAGAGGSSGLRSGGRSGLPQNYAGSSGANYNNNSYDSNGPGGGAGGPATPSSYSYQTTGTISGGPGYLSDFTSVSTYYAAGGRGRTTSTAPGQTHVNGLGWDSNGYGMGTSSATSASKNATDGVVYIRYLI